MKLRKYWALPATVLACTLAGGLLGPRISVAAAASEDDVKDSFKQFSEVLSIVEDNFVDEVEPEAAVYQGAIPRMLMALDPHSSFWDPESFERMREDQRGRYAGVGMTIQPRNDQTVVGAPFPHTPAYRAGLRPGDVIIEVDGKPMAGLNTTEVANNLRGPEGSEVEIGYERPGREGLVKVKVIRASIPRPSVPVSFKLRPDVGFVKIESFNENTGKELDDAIDAMDESSLKGLVLDLRSNRGGLLSQGVYVSEKFLEKGQTIVSHHGRASTERVYKAQQNDPKARYPIVVMVNCESASAAEIVSGALQDHDRALIMGMPTFGKGLVQTVFPLGNRSSTSGLALTTARYYTPTGRAIQRRYDGVSMVEYYGDPCSEHYKPVHSEVKLTDHGRQVYGGGGITPDIELEPHRLNDIEIKLQTEFAFDNFAQQYTLDRTDLPSGWEPTSEVVESFKSFLAKEKIPITDEEFQANLEFIKRYIKRAVYISAYDMDEGEKVYYQLDPDVEKALEALPQAAALLQGDPIEQKAPLVAKR